MNISAAFTVRCLAITDNSQRHRRHHIMKEEIEMNKELAKKHNNLKIRIPMYFFGLFLMTIGIAVSVKSNLGVSPVSSIPYTMTCVWGIEMGKATILFHTFLVLIQILLLRRNFKPVNLLQIAVGVIFGYFTTFCNYLVTFLPTPGNLPIRVS